MILNFLDSSLDGKSWEKLIISCYKQRYSQEHFEEVPAHYKGDNGIEGFTHSGIVIQCYCPDDFNLSIDDLYSKQRAKLTKDIGKFIDKENVPRLKKLGIPTIKEWHFVIPEYKDKRILEHRTSKLAEVLDAKKKDAVTYDYIDTDFKILIKVAEDYRIELSTILRTNLTNIKLNTTLLESSTPNWSEIVDNEKIKNVTSKILAITPELKEDEEDLNSLLNMYMEFYVEGLEKLERLGESFPEVRKELLELINSYKKNVTMRTLKNRDKTLNDTVFNSIQEDFTNKFEKSFNYFSEATTMELTNSIIAGWLADCSMKFK
ncbi:hypothetical protein D6T70_06300 [Kurthia gibsonii]|uniref:hypothetical protein n=1 Tax=Kurthia gibsonii TaxID=33946 RepID=UPI000EACE9C1|nr:hypothetical protein [Kurthia gibsonii]RXH52445.1 hypothetical protein D6T70_06300 [Kurthia gibsonii]